MAKNGTERARDKYACREGEEGGAYNTRWRTFPAAVEGNKKIEPPEARKETVNCASHRSWTAGTVIAEIRQKMPENSACGGRGFALSATRLQRKEFDVLLQYQNLQVSSPLSSNEKLASAPPRYTPEE